jgi:phosphotransferase system HPr (HPr) family protein
MERIDVILNNGEGLHARPASLVSKLAMKQKSSIKIIKNDNEDKIYNPKSIMSVLSMGAIKGDKLTIIAEGEDEVEAIAQLKELLENGLE